MSEETAVVKHEDTTAIALGSSGVNFQTIKELQQFALCVCKSGLAPKGMERPESVIVAIQMGLECGLRPMQALQNIAVINGRPSIWGDAALALVRGSGMLESYEAEEIGDPMEDSWGYRVTVKRRGEKACSETFTVADAKAAGLWKKSGPWSQYPKRMLMWRARGFLLRDQFGDVLKGMAIAEEQSDMVDVTTQVESDAPKIGSRADQLAEKLDPTPQEEPKKRGRKPKQAQQEPPEAAEATPEPEDSKDEPTDQEAVEKALKLAQSLATAKPVSFVRFCEGNPELNLDAETPLADQNCNWNTLAMIIDELRQK